MRRETLLTFAALAALAAISFLVFRTRPPALPASNSVRRESLPQPVIQDASSGAAPKQTPEALLPPDSPSLVLAHALERLADTPREDRDQVVRDLVRELRALGPAGLEEVRRFLLSGRDVKFRDDYRLENGRFVTAPSLRVGLLDALSDWEGSAALLLEFLRSPSTALESVTALRALERHFPGTYRREAITTLVRVLPRSGETEPDMRGELHVLAAARHFQAVEALPEIEAYVLRKPQERLPAYVQTLDSFPDDIRAEAHQRLLTREEVVAALADAPYAVNQFSFLDENVRRHTAGIFTRMDSDARVALLTSLSGSAPPLVTDELFQPNPANARPAAADTRAVAESRARQRFLTDLEPIATSAEEKEAIVEARQRVSEEIAVRRAAIRHDRDDAIEVQFAQGEGNALIKGRRIEALDLRTKVVAPKPNPADSTEPSAD